MKRIAIILFGMLFLAGLAALPQSEVAVAQSAVETIQGGIDKVSDGDSPTAESAIQSTVNMFLFIIGAVAIIMMIYGGFRYITSAGEASAISSAKNIILYSVVGLLIAIFAYAIVDFVIDRSSNGSSTAPSDPTRGGQIGPTP